MRYERTRGNGVIIHRDTYDPTLDFSIWWVRENELLPLYELLGSLVAADSELDEPNAVLSRSQLDAIEQRDKIKGMLLDAYEDLVNIMVDQHYRMTEIELRAQALWSRRRNL